MAALANCDYGAAETKPPIQVSIDEIHAAVQGVKETAVCEAKVTKKQFEEQSNQMKLMSETMLKT